MEDLITQAHAILAEERETAWRFRKVRDEIEELVAKYQWSEFLGRDPNSLEFVRNLSVTPRKASDRQL